ncbi:MAG: hypothetical protein VX498_05040 [Myxococcota bacterium]|nr:hypothetical protein [Myxococcota bacterium]
MKRSALVLSMLLLAVTWLGSTQSAEAAENSVAGSDSGPPLLGAGSVDSLGVGLGTAVGGGGFVVGVPGSSAVSGPQLLLPSFVLRLQAKPNHHGELEFHPLTSILTAAAGIPTFSMTGRSVWSLGSDQHRFLAGYGASVDISSVPGLAGMSGSVVVVSTHSALIGYEACLGPKGGIRIGGGWEPGFSISHPFTMGFRSLFTFRFSGFVKHPAFDG